MKEFTAKQRIPLSKHKEIIHLYGQGLSLREVARRTGVSRCTVERLKKIAPGSKPIVGAQRCPTCGAMVMMPCLACSLRREDGN